MYFFEFLNHQDELHLQQNLNCVTHISSISLGGRLDVYIQTWNSELALVAPNTVCLDVLEFGIENEHQYQPVFVSPSLPLPQCRAGPLSIYRYWFYPSPLTPSVLPSE